MVARGGQATLIHGLVGWSPSTIYPDRGLVPLSYEMMRARSLVRLWQRQSH